MPGEEGEAMTYEEAHTILSAHRDLLSEGGEIFDYDPEPWAAQRAALTLALEALREKHDWVEGERAALDAERGQR